MSSAMAKYVKLIDLLWEKTQKDTVPWSFDTSRNVCKLWGGENLIELSISQDDNYDNVYNLTMFNSKGIVMESFSDTYLNEASVGEGFRNYYEKMEALFELAKRRATGADKALDSFIDLLEGEAFDVPF